MTEHQLKIKTVLDTQDVQNQLNKLRGQYLGNGQGGNGIAGANQANNLNSLTSTLTRLNNTIAQLQKAIGMLSKGVASSNQKLNTPLQPNRSQVVPPITFSNGQSNGLGLGSYTQKIIEKQVKEEVLAAILHRPQSILAQQLPGRGGIFFGSKGTASQQDTFNRMFAGMTPSDFIRAGKLRPEAREYFADVMNTQPNWFQKNLPNFSPTMNRPGKGMMAGIRLMAGSYMLGGLSQLGQGLSWEESPITKGVGTAAGAASGGLMAGGAAAMMGLGPIGIAAAAAVPVIDDLSKAIGELASEKIMKVASSLQRANDAWESMYQSFQKWDFGKFKERVSGLDFGNLAGERDAARSQYDADKKDYDEFMSGWVSRMRSLDKQYYSGQITAGQYATAKQDANTELEGYKEALEKSKERLDEVNRVYEQHKEAIEGFNNVVKQAAEFDKRLSEFDAEQVSRHILKSEDPEKIKTLLPAVQADIAKATSDMQAIRDAGGLAEYERGTNAYREKLLTTDPNSKEADSLREIIKARDEAAEAYKKSASDLMKAVAKSKNLEDAIENLQKQLQEYAKSATQQKASLAQSQEEAINRYDQRWETLGNGWLDKSSKEYWEKARRNRKDYEDALGRMQNANTPEEAKLAQEQANEAKSNWEFNERQALSFDQTIVGKLQEKLSELKTPDNTQVTSLASQGLMINKSDDEIRWKQQVDYASQQTQIQREIRDRLNQMDSNSTFQ